MCALFPVGRSCHHKLGDLVFLPPRVCNGAKEPEGGATGNVHGFPCWFPLYRPTKQAYQLRKTNTHHTQTHMAVGPNPVPLVNIKNWWQMDVHPPQNGAIASPWPCRPTRLLHHQLRVFAQRLPLEVGPAHLVPRAQRRQLRAILTRAVEDGPVFRAWERGVLLDSRVPSGDQHLLENTSWATPPEQHLLQNPR